MKRSINGIILGLVALAAGLFAYPAAATVIFPNNPNYVANMRTDAINSLTSAYTNSTTTATDLTGTAMTLPLTNLDYTKQFIRVCWSADATKATSTTGSIGVFVNGALQTDSLRYVNFAAGRNAMSACYTIQRSSAAAQVVKLQGASQDTAAFTVTNAQMDVFRIYVGG